ncbi:MAG: cupin domain-containing protein [Hyphomicrobiales bacterium]|nr:cupin domain-containing protein [Hyphomicrobiales bacterium]MBV9589695.1 cupin domain-containing protein [Hyphomicrobiales bacterium]MBV9973827.1 cupin domain-containing protein [Hyphomicrobiales bacterium]
MAQKFTAREPAAASVLCEDDRARVTRYDFAPGAETGWHVHHMPYVVVPLTDCEFLIESASGVTRVTQKAGAAYSRDRGVEHNVVNGGEAPMAFIEIEIKPIA